MTTKDTEDKLFTVKSTPDTESHLTADEDSCRRCEGKACLYVCPADVYSWDEKEQKVSVAYENCLECGACRIACDKQTLSWKYPKSGFGVTFKQG